MGFKNFVYDFGAEKSWVNLQVAFGFAETLARVANKCETVLATGIRKSRKALVPTWVSRLINPIAHDNDLNARCKQIHFCAANSR